MAREKATLALADGTIFEGYQIGASGETAGEVVFNTSLYGYQEILTDPSYVRQMITFTYPHIGNVGVNPDDVDSKRMYASGVIVRELSEQHSNFRSTGSLKDYLIKNNFVGIGGVDTRKLVLHLRTHGAQMGVIATGQHNPKDLVEKARKQPSMEGLDLVPEVSTAEPYGWSEGTYFPFEKNSVHGYRKYSESDLRGRPHVVAVDCGIKHNILRLLTDHGFRVTVVPAKYTAEQMMKLSPDGIFLSNGPGDPAAVTYLRDAVKALLGKKPIFGICLGHQILGHAVGAPTFKLKFGHRGGNHPVRNIETGRVEITVQNHGFATDKNKIPKGVNVTHINLNDQTIEGLSVDGAKAFSVQYHPEASPGPTDAQYLFKQFAELVERG